MATIFDTIITQGVRSGQIPARTQDARDWFRETAGAMRNVNERTLMKGDQARLTSAPIVGSMYMFYYDPKWKDELPYYDRFPLVFPFRKVPGGFYGLNLHYLPHTLRARLMDLLYDRVYGVSTPNDIEENKRIRITYAILKRISKNKIFVPCIKKYLYQQLSSRIYILDPKDWELAMYLPSERFVKANKDHVWRDSINKIRNS